MVDLLCQRKNPNFNIKTSFGIQYFWSIFCSLLFTHVLVPINAGVIPSWVRTNAFPSRWNPGNAVYIPGVRKIFLVFPAVFSTFSRGGIFSICSITFMFTCLKKATDTSQSFPSGITLYLIQPVFPLSRIREPESSPPIPTPLPIILRFFRFFNRSHCGTICKKKCFYL